MIKIHSFQSDDLISTTIVLLEMKFEMLFERDIFVKDEDEENNHSKKSLKQRKFQMQVELITVEFNLIDRIKTEFLSLSIY
jgi:FtsZ-binding cell division protein ZapB